MNDEILTIEQAAKILGVSTKTMRRWDASGKLSPVRTVGNHRRYTRSEIDEFMKTRSASQIAQEASEDTSSDTPAEAPVSTPPTPGSADWMNFVAQEEKQQNTNSQASRTDVQAEDDTTIIYDEAPASQFHLPRSSKKGIAMVAAGLGCMIVVLLITFFQFPENGMFAQAKDQMKNMLPGSESAVSDVQTTTLPSTLANNTQPKYQFQISVPALFGKKTSFLDDAEVKKTLKVDGKLIAPNVVYSINAGDNITISGDPQNPTISAGTTGVSSFQGVTGAVALTNGQGISLNGLQVNNTGVLSVQGQSGDVQFSAGDGISLSGLTITNDDPGSAQSIFKTFSVSGTDIVADSNTDTITFAAGSGVTLNADASTKTITINAPFAGGSQWTTTGSDIYYNSGNVGIGNTAPTAALDVTGNARISGSLTLSSLGTGILRSNGSGVLSSSAIALGSSDVSGTLGIGNGGTGVTGTPTNGQLLIGNGSGYTLGTISGGSGIGISNGSGTISVTNNGVLSLTGTANQISTSGATGAITLSLPQNIHTGATPTFASLTLTANTNQLTLGTGNTGTITMATLTTGRTYTLPDASGEICLSSGNCPGGGGGNLSGTGTGNYLAKFTGASTLGNSAIYESGGKVGIGTSSPEGLFSVSGGAAGNALVSLNETGDQNILTGSASGTTRFVFDRLGNLNIIGGAYQIGGSNVLTSTTLGSGVTSSSLTTVGALNSGSIISGFGTISTGNTITGTTINGTTGINTGAGAGTVRIDGSGNLANIGTINASGTVTLSSLGTGIVHSNASGVLTSGAVNLATEVTGTLGVTNGGIGISSIATGDLLYGSGTNTLAARTIGSAGQVLTVVGGLPTWVDPSALSSAYWQRNGGLLSPVNIADDFAIGGTSTSSAKFQVFGSNGNATTSGTLTFNTAGNIQTTNNQTLTVGGNSTGNIVFSPLNGAGTVSVNGTMNLTSGNAYQINGATVLNSTSLGSSVVNSSLTSVGALVSGSIANGFGTIATNNSISGASLGIAGTTVIDNSRNAVNLANVTASGTITFSGLGQGIAHLSSGGVLSSSAVNLATEVTGTLGAANGGTGFNTYTQGDLLYGNGSSTLSRLGVGSAGQILTVSGGMPVWSDAGGTINFWQRGSGVLSPLSISDDLLVGGNATNSARFQISGTTGDATTSGNLTFNSAASVQTTNNRTLTFGGNSTGNIIFSPLNGAGTVTINGDLSLVTGKVYQINGANVLSATTLGSSVVSSSLTSVGSLNLGSITSGFGNIDVGADSIAGGDITANGTTGFTATGNGAGLTFSGTGNHDITASAGTLRLGPVTLNGAVAGNNQNVTGLNNLSAVGAITFSTFTSNGGILYTNASGILAQVAAGTSNQVLHGGTNPSFGAVALGADVSGTLPVANGGTGATSVGSAGSVSYSNGTTYAFTGVGSNGQVLLSNGSSAPTWVDPTSLGNTYFQRVGGALSPMNITDDLLLGSTATTGAKFAFMNVAGGTPTASISANVGNNALYLTGDGTLATTNKQTLTLGSTSTGNIVLNGFSAGVIKSNASGVLSSGSVILGTDTTGNYVSNVSGGSGIGVSGSAGAGWTPTLSLAALTANWDQTGAFDIVLNNSGSELRILESSGGTYYGTIDVGDLTNNSTYTFPDGSGTVCILEVANCTGGASSSKWQRNGTVLAPLTATDEVVLGGGTTTPFQFEVNGSQAGKALVSLNETGDQDIFTASASGTTRLVIGNNGNLFVNSANGSDLFSFQTGNIQVGNGSPTNTLNGEDLYVEGGLEADGAVRFDNSSITFGDSSFANCSALETIGNVLTCGTDDSGAGSAGFTDDGQVVRLTTATDQLGIGTASPFGKFQVEGAVAGKALTILNETGDQNILTGSASGTTRFVFDRSGNLNLSGGGYQIGGTTVIDASRNIANAVNLTASGTITFSGLGQGIAHLSSGGVLSSSALNLATEVTGTLGVANGGTGATSVGSAGSVAYSNGSAYAFTGAGTSGQVLQSNGTSAPTWVDVSSLVTNYWQRNDGLLSPFNITNDFAVGGNATSSAKFQVFGLTGNATTSGTLTFNTAGNIQTTNNQTLTFGGNSTGNIVFSPLNGAGTVSVNGTMNLTSGNVYQINGATVLSNNTLGSGVTTSSLTTVGALASGSIANGFGTIATNNSISGNTLGIGGTTVIDNSRNAVNLANVTASGTITFSGLGQGIAHLSSGGVLSSSAVNLATEVTGTLGAANGGTGFNTYAQGDLLVGNGSSTLSKLALGSPGQYLTVSGGNLTWSDINGSINFWQRASGLLAPLNITDDLAIGGNATSSAKFQIFGLTGNATTSGNLTFNSAATVQTTNNQTLTIGGNSTGNIVFSPLNGAGTVSINGTMNLASGNVYQINGATVLSNNTLGSGVTTSSLTTVGALASGSIANGFGTIATNNSISGNTLGIGGTTVIDNSRNLTNIVGVATDLNPTAANTRSLGTSTGNQYANIYGQTLYQNGNQVCDTGGNCNGLTTTFWNQSNGAVYTKNSTVDFLVGGQASDSAKFAVLNVNSGTPTASLSAGAAGGSYLSAAGLLQTTANQTLTIGGNSTGNIVFSPLNGAGTVSVNGLMNLASGNAYQINGTTVLSNNTLGSGVTTSSLTSVGALASGSIANGFGTIATNNSISGSSLGIGGTTVIDNSRNIGNAVNLTASGTITFSGLGQGIAHLSSGGVLSSSAVNLATEVTGTLPTGNGGTGQTTYAQGDLLYGNGSGGLSKLALGGPNQFLTATGGNLVWTDANGAINFWQRALGVLSPLSIADDFAIGGTATGSAKFQIFGSNGNATTSGSLTFNTAGNVQTTNNQTLTFGGNSTGNIVFSPLNGAGTVSVNGIMNLASGNVYQINGTTVLSNNTLGSGVTTSSLTTVGALASGSIANGFGTIATNNSISGASLGIAGTTVVDNSRNIANVVNLAASGTITFSGLGQGIAHLSSGGVLSSSAVNLATEVTGTLGTTNGGTGLNSYATGDLLYASGANTLAARTIGSNGQILTVSGGVPVWSDAGGTINFWQRAGGAVAPLNITDDLLLGATATGSAKFAFTNVAGGTPTASISANAGNIATYLTGDGALGTTSRSDLTLGNSAAYNTTGNILLNSNGTGQVAIGTTSPIAGSKLDVRGISAFNYLTNPSGYGINVGGGIIISQYSAGNPNAILGALESGAGFLFQNNMGGTPVELMRLSSTGSLGLGATTPLARLDVRGNSGTLPVASISGNTSFAAGIIDQSGVGDLFTASKSGATKFTILNNGNLQLNNYTNNGGLLYTNGSGVVAQTGTGTGTQCLLGGATPTWGSCSTGTTNYWQQNSGSLAPSTVTDKLVLGGNTTTEHQFEVNGRQTGKALVSINETGDQALFTASASGTTRFTINNAGDLILGSTTRLTQGGVGTFANSTVVGTATFGANTITDSGALSLTSTGANTLTLQSAGTGNIQFFNGNNTLTSAGVLTVASNLIVNGTTATFGNGSNATLQTSSNANLTLSAAGTGNLIFASDANSGVKIGSSSNTDAPLSVSGGIGSNAAFIVNNTNNGDLIAASASGTTKFTVDTNGNIGIAAGSGIDALTSGNLSIGNGSTTNTVTIGRSGQSISLPGYNNCGMLTTSGTSLTCSSAPAAGTNYWNLSGGAFSPINATADLLIGGTATDSAKFAFMNVSNGTPTASVSAGATGATYLAANGAIQTTAMQTLTLGGSTTGNITLSPQNGSGTVTSTGNLNLASGKAFQIAGADVLTSSTLGTGVLASSLTSVGALNGGSITSGFGSIDIGGDNLTAGGTITFSGLGSGIVKSASGVLSASAIGLNTADVTGTLGVANGGTGTGTAFTQGSIVFAGGSGVYNQNNNNFFWDNTNLRLGIGANSNLQAALDVRSTNGTSPAASVAGNTTFAAMVVDQADGGDIFTASKSGATKFTIRNSGAVVIGSATNGITFDPTNSSAPVTYSGTARPTKKITLSPEYAGAVLTASGSGSTTGIMTSDASPSATFRNYYQWVSSQTSLHQYTVAVRTTLPQDFDGWTTNSAVTVDLYTNLNTATSNKVDIKAIKASDGTIVVLDQNQFSGTAKTWATRSYNANQLQTLSAGDTVVFYLTMYSKDNMDTMIGDIVLNYLSKF